MKEHKYKIPELLDEIEDKELKENIQGAIMFKLRISVRTWYRKAFSKVGQNDSSHTFTIEELETIAGVFNTRTKCVPILIPDDLITKTPTHV